MWLTAAKGASNRRNGNMQSHRSVSALSLCFLSLVSLGFAGCNSSSSTTPASISITASSSKASIDQGQSTTVTASLTNDSSNKGVRWSVSCSAAACGSVSPQTTTSGMAATYTAPGNAAKVTMTATSVADTTKTGTVSVTVNATPTITPPAGNTLPSATVGAAYSFDLNTLLTGGTTPITWSLSSGTLPAGLSLSSSGMITGTPTQPTVARRQRPGAVASQALSSQVSLTFSAQDSGNPPVTSTVQLALAVNPAALTITTTSLPDGTVSQAYGPSGAGVTVTATGGVTPYAWSWAAQSGSSLPPGLSIDPSTGTITGTPTTTGTFNVTITVTDSESPAVTASANFTLTVAAIPSLTITTGGTLANATFNTTYTATVNATGGVAPYTWTVATGSSLPTGLTLASGTPGATVSGKPTVTGTFSFTLQVSDSESPAATATASFQLTISESSSVTCPTTVNLTLCGTYTLGLGGFNASKGPIALGGSFVADNSSHVASGTVRINSSTNSSGAQTLTVTGGSYAMDASNDGRGVLTLIYSDASSATFRYSLESAANAGADPIEEFDASGTLASGILVGPVTPPFAQIPANSILSLPLEGINDLGQRAGLLGEFQVGSKGCDGSSGSFNSLSGESVITNTQGTISKVTFTGSCSPIDTTTGLGTAAITVSGGTPFSDTTLNFVYAVGGIGTSSLGAFFLETDAIGSNQPILNGLASSVTIPTGGYTASILQSGCPCIFTGHATTDGTITAGDAVETIIRVVFTAANATSGTFTGIEDQNAGGSLTLDANVSGSYTIDANGFGTITPTGGSTIHFIIDSIGLESLDEGTGVEGGSARGQNATSIQNPGSAYVFGVGIGNLGATPSNVNVVGVVTPSGTSTSGTLSGTLDIMPGQIVGATASATYTIDSTTGRGTGTANFTGGSTPINVIIWVRRNREFVILDVQTANPDLIGARLQ